MTRNTNMIDLLTKKGLKASPARIKILGVCVSSTTPLDVSQVYEKLAGRVHLATVYRTLERFVTAGLLERIDFQEGKFRYEYVHAHHHHAVCNSCGKVEDVIDTGIETIESNIRKDSGFLVTKHALELFGFCNTCQTRSHHV